MKMTYLMVGLIILLAGCGRGDGVLLRTNEMVINDCREEAFASISRCNQHDMPLVEKIVGYTYGLHYPGELYEERKKHYFPFALANLQGGCGLSTQAEWAVVRTCKVCDHLDRIYTEQQTLYAIAGKGIDSRLAGIIYDDRAKLDIEDVDVSDPGSAIIEGISYNEVDIQALAADLKLRLPSISIYINPEAIAFGTAIPFSCNENRIALRDLLHRIEVQCMVSVILFNRNSPEQDQGAVILIGY